MNEYVNPEPPPEIAQIKKEDQIGNTLFSKHWLCNLLLKLIKVFQYFLYAKLYYILSVKIQLNKN